MDKSVPHRRKQPEAWPRLVTKSEKAIRAPKKLSRMARFRLARKVDKLSDLELERNNFYGYGRIMCGLAQRLEQPDTRNQVIEGIAAGMIDAAKDRRIVSEQKPFIPQVGDLHLGKLTHAFMKPTFDAWCDLSSAEQLLTNTLTETYNVRRGMAEDNFDMNATLHFMTQIITSKKVSQRNLPVKNIAVSALGASTEILKVCLNDLPMGQELTDHQKATPIDLEEVRTIVTTKNLAPIGRLRLDEFFAGYGWSDETPSTFDPRALAKPAPQKILHSIVLPERFERLGCEAFYVGNLAMDVATNILPAALEMSTVMSFERAEALAPPM